MHGQFYRQDENSQNAIISYYTKGAMVALCLDLTLRTRTNGAVSLDDVMDVLWSRYGKTGVGVGERDIEAIAAEVSGLDLDGFFQQSLYSTQPLPVAECMAQVGLKMGLRQAKSQTDKGGTRGADNGSEKLGLAARLVQTSAGQGGEHAIRWASATVRIGPERCDYRRGWSQSLSRIDSGPNEAEISRRHAGCVRVSSRRADAF